MPNHVDNTISVTNITSEQAQRIIAAVERENLAGEFMPQPEWKSTPNEDGICPGPEYYERHNRHRLWQGGPLSIVSSRYPNGEHDQRWYGWNNTAWGTKWGIYDMTVDYDEDSQSIYITGQTAWSPLSAQWFEEFSRQLPGAEIVCHFSEPGCDFYGVTLAKEGSAVEAVEAISDVKDAWIAKNFSPEQVAILEDDDHVDYDEVYDLVNDQWWDVECDVMEPAYEALLTRLREEFRETRSELKGEALVEQLKKLDISPEDLKHTRKILHAAVMCGYIPQRLAATEELSMQREQELRKCLERFKNAVSSTHWMISYVTKESIKGLGLK